MTREWEDKEILRGTVTWAVELLIIVRGIIM